MFHQPHEEFRQLTRGTCATGPVQSALPTPTKYFASSTTTLLLLESVRTTTGRSVDTGVSEIGDKRGQRALAECSGWISRGLSVCPGWGDLWGGKGWSRPEETPRELSRGVTALCQRGGDAQPGGTSPAFPVKPSKPTRTMQEPNPSAASHRQLSSAVVGKRDGVSGAREERRAHTTHPVSSAGALVLPQKPTAEPAEAQRREKQS